MTNPSVSDFKAYWDRDFPYGTTSDTVKDTDVQKALDMADVNFNSGLWSTQGRYTIAFLCLSAHYLVMNLRASSQGIAGSYSWLTTSKSVETVSEGFQVPDRILNHPILSMYSKTAYGARYLELVLPMLAGQVYTVADPTLA